MAKVQGYYHVATSIEFKGHSTKNNARSRRQRRCLKPARRRTMMRCGQRVLVSPRSTRRVHRGLEIMDEHRRLITITVCFHDGIRAARGGERSWRGTGGSYCSARTRERRRLAPPACARREIERSHRMLRRRRADAGAGVMLADVAGTTSSKRTTAGSTSRDGVPRACVSCHRWTRIDREVFQLSREMVRPSVAIGGRCRGVVARSSTEGCSIWACVLVDARSTTGRWGAVRCVRGGVDLERAAARHDSIKQHGGGGHTPCRSEAGLAVLGDLCLGTRARTLGR